MSFFVYILECADSSFYIGSTNDLGKRVRQHNGAKSGAKYTRARRPVVLRYAERCRTYARVRAREAELKRLTRQEKLAFLAEQVRRGATLPALSVASRDMGKGDNSQRKEKKKPKKEKPKK